MQQNIAHLLKTRRFLPLFIVQFLGAMNDNVFKNALMILIVYRLASENGPALVTLAGGLFILPYFFFSALAGQLADRYEKSQQIQWIKLAEIMIMILGAIGFLWGDKWFLIGILILMGMQSSFFGPLKYGILPDHLEEDELIGGNGLIEAGTFLSILLGTIVGGLVILAPATSYSFAGMGFELAGAHYISILVIGLALMGYIASRYIPETRVSSPDLQVDKNIFVSTWKVLSNSLNNYVIFLLVLGISWFWLLGATVLSQFPALGAQVLRVDEQVVTLFLALFSIGIALGSLICNRLLQGEVSARLVPWGGMGMSLFLIDLYFAVTSGHLIIPTEGSLVGIGTFIAQPAAWRIMIDLFGMAMAAGLFIVPLYALLQERSEDDRVSRNIAANNIMNAIFMAGSAALIAWLLSLGVTVPQVLLAAALINLPIILVVRPLMMEKV